MAVHPRAGQPADPSDLVDVARLVTAFYAEHPDPTAPEQRVSFGTSGHRGSSLTRSFNEDHILAISQSICDWRSAQRLDGPLFLVRDTHALSEPAFASALEVFAGNDVDVVVDARHGHTPTPALSRAVLSHNAGRTSGVSDGVVVTPSHNPPTDGGFKYNPPHGGPAESAVTSWIAKRANELLVGELKGVRRVGHNRAKAATHAYDFVDAYVRELPSAVDLDAIRASGIVLGVDPLGGASVAYWNEIADRYGIDLTVQQHVDPTFRFMTLDWDGKIRMDCSSRYAMASLIDRRADFQIAVGNDADADRHGVVTRETGLLEANHYLAASIHYLFGHRPDWSSGAAVGKTLVSSRLIDRVAEHLDRGLVEVPVGFKWFVPGLLDGSIAFGGEESAGASFLRYDGGVWTTDKDGILMGLLAAEISARTGASPDELYRRLADRFGDPSYARIESPATREEKARLSALSPDAVRAKDLGGEPITALLTTAPGNNAPIGGLKVETESGWFAARPSGTEDVYKIYAESFQGPEHLTRIQDEAVQVVSAALRSGD
ncbi:alpha-D-glucose phosphate-specific phosphoglucomutase [Saccharopolyspora rhizosphaerae]|uniref:Alpha-D-glucose phosphate-specific phosphoglucomutase n=1 Tax=Saccharopolyspora rhizosphaerae TaxID=2492662 RepID=A0A426JWT7_9PSEU|nr:phosphoglucomutase (alpha-D-glucose-1,6-bisphosphate-dependent) [Saccharopolyspora rhizosphaerae]RRO17660.1 alpha-D-glucose phosphate-specific phosphoglucomutase [Saccharopolyspora rhizosphaerae]